MVCMCVGEYPSWHGFNRDFLRDFHRNTELCYAVFFSLDTIIRDCIEVGVASKTLRDLP